jgi:hypothetical protein
VPGAHAGGAYTTTQWISLPDDQPASYHVDASQAVANAKAAGITTLDIVATISITHHDADGVVQEVMEPISIQLNLDHAVSASAAIPVLAKVDRMPPGATCGSCSGSSGPGAFWFVMVITSLVIIRRAGSGRTSKRRGLQ